MVFVYVFFADDINGLCSCQANGAVFLLQEQQSTFKTNQSISAHFETFTPLKNKRCFNGSRTKLPLSRESYCTHEIYVINKYNRIDL